MTPSLSSSSNPLHESNHNDETNAATSNIVTTQETTTDSSVKGSSTTITPQIQRRTWNPFRLAVLRGKMTEPAMTSPLNYGNYKNDRDASFHCAYCDHTLFPSYAKYNSGTGWPSFWRTAQSDSVAYHREWDGRLECRCAKCQSHLGHVFLDGPHPSTIANPDDVASAPTTDPRSRPSSTNSLPRFCINGLALTYQPSKSNTTTST